jgi:hypothetical protein
VCACTNALEMVNRVVIAPAELEYENISAHSQQDRQSTAKL